MVLDVDGQVLLAGLEGNALRDGPAGQGAVALETEVVVEAPRVVPLDDEDRLLSCFRPAFEGLGRGPRVTLAAIVTKSAAGHERAAL